MSFLELWTLMQTKTRNHSQKSVESQLEARQHLLLVAVAASAVAGAGRAEARAVLEFRIFQLQVRRDVAGLLAALELALVRIDHIMLDLRPAVGVDRVR